MGGRNLKETSPFMVAKPLYIEPSYDGKLLSNQCPKTPTISKYCEKSADKVKIGLQFLNKYAANVKHEEAKHKNLENYQNDMDEKISVNSRGDSINNSKNFIVMKDAEKKQEKKVRASPKIQSNEKKETKQFDFRTYLQQIDNHKASPFPLINNQQYKNQNAFEIMLGKKLNS